jgi:hypothetical protein
MSALPDTTPSTPAATEPAVPPQAEQDEQPRHLRSVDPAEVTTEIPVIADDTRPDATAEAPTDDTTPGAAQRVKGIAKLVTATFTPGSGLYTDRSPSVKEVWHYGRRGSQAPEAGWARRATTGYGMFAAANKTATRTWDWIVENPSRFAVMAVLIVLAALFPPTRVVLHLLLWPLHAAWAVTD